MLEQTQDPTAPVVEEQSIDGVGLVKNITSTPSHLKMLRFEPEAYAGITPKEGRSMVILFPEDEKLVEFRGDQGAGKSSHLAALKALLGGKEPPNAINSIVDNKKAELEFMLDETKYIAKITKSGFSLSEIQEVEGGKPIKKALGSPVAVIQKFIGPLGTDPGYLKAMEGAAQIKWLRSLLKTDGEAAKFEVDLKVKYDAAYNGRTVVNRELKFAKKVLLDTPYYEWDDKNKTLLTTAAYEGAKAKFAQDDTEREAALKAEYEQAKEFNKEYTVGEQTLARYREAKGQNENNITSVEEEIYNLQIRLQKLKEERVDIIEREKKGEQYLSERKDAAANLAAVEAKMQAEGTYQLAKKVFVDSKKDHNTYHDRLNASLSLNAQLDELAKIKQRLIAEITPDIPGLEVCVPQNIDVAVERESYMLTNPEATEEEVQKHILEVKHETREGIFFNKHSVDQLSESELWDLWLQLCRVQGLKAVFIENIQSLGTAAVERVNQLATDGCWVFVSAMERGTKEMKISFYHQLDK